MKINSRTMGVAVAITAASVWSIYSAGVFCSEFIGIFPSGRLGNPESINLTVFLYDYLGRLIALVLASGIASWVIAEIYNSLNDLLATKLK